MARLMGKVMVRHTKADVPEIPTPVRKLVRLRFSRTEVCVGQKPLELFSFPPLLILREGIYVLLHM